MLHKISILEEDESKVCNGTGTTVVYVISDTLESVQWPSPHHLPEGGRKEA